MRVQIRALIPYFRNREDQHHAGAVLVTRFSALQVCNFQTSRNIERRNRSPGVGLGFLVMRYLRFPPEIF
jgi:hypothetical protein